MLEWFVTFMLELSFVEMLWSVLLVTPVSVLLHELGHAVAATLLAGEDVELRVGNAGPAARRRIAGVEIEARAVAAPWRIDGLTTFNPDRCPPGAIVAIALAGPLCSAVACLVAGKLVLALETGSFLYTVLGQAVIMNGIGVILCLVPMTVSERRDGPSFETDGLVALRALRLVLAR